MEGHGCLLDLLFGIGDIFFTAFHKDHEVISDQQVWLLIAYAATGISLVLLLVNVIWHPHGEFFRFCFFGLPIFAVVAFLLAGVHGLFTLR